MNPVKFGVFTLIGGAPFIAGLVYAGMVLRSRWNLLVPYFNYADYAIVVAAAVFLIWVFVRWHRESRTQSTEPSAPGPSP